MASTDILKIIISLQDRASAGLRAMRISLGTLSSGFDKLSNVVFSLKGALGGLAVGAVAKSFVNAADTAEQYRTRLTVLLGSQKKANELFSSMSDYAATVSNSYEDIMDSATNLSAVMEGGQKEVEKWMPIITDLSVAAGLGVRETTGQIMRMYSTGAAAAEMFKEKGTLSMLGFQAGVSYTAEETRKQLIAAFEDPASKFRGASKLMATTWTGMLSMMGDRWFQFRNKVMGSGLFDYIEAAMSVLLGRLDTLDKNGSLEDWAQRSSKAIILLIKDIARAFGWLAESMRGFQMLWESLGLAAIKFKKLAVDSVRVVAEGINAVTKAYNRMNTLLGGRSRVLSSIIDDQKGKIQSLREMGESIENDARASWRRLNALVDQKSAVEQMDALLLEIDKKIAERKKEVAGDREIGSPEMLAGGTGGKGGKRNVYTLDEQLRAEVDAFAESTKTTLAKLDQFYNQNMVTLEQYYDKRKELLEEGYLFELERLERIANTAKTREEQEKAVLDVARLQGAHTRELISLEQERLDAVKERAEEEAELQKQRVAAEREIRQIVGGAQFRAGQAGADPIQAGQASAVHSLAQQQLAARERLQELQAEGYATEADMQKLHHAQSLERERLYMKQREEIQEGYVSTIKGVFGELGGAFQGFSKAFGKENKAFFEAYKLTAIAEAVIATYQGAQKAYASLASVPPLAVAAAGAAIAAGLARVAVIRNQKLAAGGVVQDLQGGGSILGYSASRTSDNISISATAGEFMHPVDTVRYYGIRAMEALRRRMIPPSVLAPFTGQISSVARGSSLAMGGLATAGAGAGSSYSVTVPITTIDASDRLAERLRSSVERTVRDVLEDELA